MTRGIADVASVEATLASTPPLSKPLRVEQRIARFSERKLLVIVLAGVLSLAGRALLLPFVPVPRPAIQDEFSYLLGSDTFASGRLTNPTPLGSEHFESPQVNMHPSYASRYPPFSAMAMALGQRLTGQPWVGVWLAMAVLCTTLCWALQGWLPPIWAMVGTLIALLRIGVISYWTESYWGGTCAGIGGALLIGALPRLARRPSAGSATAFAAGLVILANTRPYEGLVMAVVAIGYLFIRLVSAGRLARAVRMAVVPMSLVLLPSFVWLGYYNYRVSGDPFKLPYVAHEQQYVVASPFLWDRTVKPEPNYTSASLRDFWVLGDAGAKLDYREHMFRDHASDFLRIGRFFLGWPLILCALASARALWRDRIARTALLLGGAFCVGVAFEVRMFPHYAAPAVALAYIAGASTLRAVRKSWPGGSLERLYVALGLLAVVALTSTLSWLTPKNLYLFGDIDYHVPAKHATVADRIAQQPGDHLILVSYGPHHDLYEELVYNQADIAHSRIIWARSLSELQDQLLIRQYPGRKIWWLEEDGTVKLSAYSDQYKRYYYQPLTGISH